MNRDLLGCERSIGSTSKKRRVLLFPANGPASIVYVNEEDPFLGNMVEMRTG